MVASGHLALPNEGLPERVPSVRSLRALDALNFFLADVRDGIGPYLAIYLLTTRHWDPARIGVAMSVMGVAAVVTQTPVGALVDRLTQKRLLVVIAALFIGINCVTIAIFGNFYAIVTAQAVSGVVAATFLPAIAAISLGLVGHKKLAARIGRNEAFNHAGNVGVAILAGLVGHFIGYEWIFYLVTVAAAASILSALFIKAEDIDHRLARGAKSAKGSVEEHPSGAAALLTDRRIVFFALAVTLFHFANAAMLPLAGQLLSTGKTRGASLSLSACIIAAQMVMVPVATWAGRGATRWGRRPIFLIGFAVLPIRGFLYTLSDNSLFIIAVQFLDGIGAGIFGVLWVLVVADLTKGTGRYNVTQGVIATAQGSGAAFSNLLAGYIVEAAGYNAAFVSLAGIAAVALAVFYFTVPETKDVAEAEQPCGVLSAAAIN